MRISGGGAIYRAAGEDELLLERKKIGVIASGLACACIAFPLIAAGVYGFPKDEALQIALELDMRDTLDPLTRAEIEFSPSSRSDMVIAYFIANRIYDIFEINAALFKYGLPILGE